MKRKAIVYAAVILLASACEKEAAQQSPGGASLSFHIGEPETKAYVASSSAESMMKSLDVYVFFNDNGLGSANGQLETYRHYTPGTSTFEISGKDAIKVSHGAKTVAFVANAPSDMPAGIRSISDFNNWETHSWSFSDNAIDKFVMTSKKNITISGDIRLDSTKDSTLMLKRLVSRVEFKGFRNDLPASLGKLTLEGAYLYNVNKTIDNSAGADDNFWRKKDAGTALSDAAVEKLVNPGAYLPSAARFAGSLAKGSSWSEKKENKYYMYGFPNPVPEASDAGSKDWVTKLVIQTKVNGIRYYYPIGLKGMESNKTYVINNVTVSRLGSTSPDKYVSTASLSLSISVLDWTTGNVTGNFNGTLEGNGSDGWTISL
ncbi:MAG: hypothetical protein IIU05_04520 [Bacteroidales bacterium]|nr:hypothetical protein [Bacteroidales bacterium]